MSKFRYSVIVVLLLLGQVVDVVGGADQAGFLGAPPGEAHLVARLDLGHLLGHLEDGRAAGAVVLDARARR